MKSALRYAPFIVAFTATFVHPIDADFGWHFRYGQLFLATGHIARDNLFSTTMTNFYWVNHSWGTDVLTWLLFFYGGFRLIAIAGAAVSALMIWVFFRTAHVTLWQQSLMTPVILYLEYPLLLASWRSQLISQLLLGVLLLLLQQTKNYRSWLTVPLFLLWANLHGGFIIGVGVFALWILTGWIQSWWQRDKQEYRLLLLPFVCSLLATLCTPWEISLYREALHHGNNELLQSIMEWTPLAAFSFLWWVAAGWGLLILTGIAVATKTKRIASLIPWIILTALFFILGVTSRRYIWPMYVLSLPIVAPLLDIVKLKKDNYATWIAGFLLTASYCWILFSLMPTRGLGWMSWEQYCVRTGCSITSAEYLKNHPGPGPLFTNYSWGGFLIYNYPKIKPSIDGRMTLWRDNKGYSAFAIYMELEQNLADIETSAYNTAYVAPDKPIYKRLTQLAQEGKWITVYEDKKAAIFVRRTTSL